MGKILLILEVIGGKDYSWQDKKCKHNVYRLKYSLEDDSFVFGENLPAEWSFMEFNVPVLSAEGEEDWVQARVDRECLELFLTTSSAFITCLC